MRCRSMTVSSNEVIANTRWIRPELEVREYGKGGVIKKTRIVIEHPCDIREIRNVLDDIENYWRTCLGDKT